MDYAIYCVVGNRPRNVYRRFTQAFNNRNAESAAMNYLRTIAEFLEVKVKTSHRFRDLIVTASEISYDLIPRRGFSYHVRFYVAPLL